MEPYWFMFALPLVLAVGLSDSPMRLWPAWVGVYVATSQDHWGRLDSRRWASTSSSSARSWATLSCWRRWPSGRSDPSFGGAGVAHDIQEAHDGSPDVLRQREKAAAAASS